MFGSDRALGLLVLTRKVDLSSEVEVELWALKMDWVQVSSVLGKMNIIWSKIDHICLYATMASIPPNNRSTDPADSFLGHFVFFHLET